MGINKTKQYKNLNRIFGVKTRTAAKYKKTRGMAKNW